MSARPSISVIVATVGRPERLERVLGCLDNQSLPQDRWDLCVVIDGSDAASAAVLTRWQERLPRLRWVETGTRRGPAAARNRAIQETTGEVVAMTDDDCEPQPGWLAALDAFLAARPDTGMVFGKTVTDPSRLTPFSHYVENHGGEGHQTCNCAYRRDLLERLGNFDERFPFAYLEDTDLYCRALEFTQAGFCAEALVIHPPRETRWQDMGRSVRRFEADFIFHAKDSALYRRRHDGNGPMREVVWTVAVKHAFRQALSQRGWLFRNPLVYAQFLLALAYGSLLIWTGAPRWSSRHRLDSGGLGSGDTARSEPALGSGS